LHIDRFPKRPALPAGIQGGLDYRRIRVIRGRKDKDKSPYGWRPVATNAMTRGMSASCHLALLMPRKTKAYQGSHRKSEMATGF
jgi:hypothetical protein